MKEESGEERETGESEGKKGMKMSGEWKEKHEGRMRNVGVRTSSVENEVKREEERELTEELREGLERVRPRLEDKEKANSLGDGWSWG